MFNELIFRYVGRVSGKLCNNYVFTSKSSFMRWKRTSFNDLKEAYGESLVVHGSKLDPLKIGDECHVYGDGSEIYKIVGIKQNGPNRYSFALDSGFYEEVAKCYSVKN